MTQQASRYLLIIDGSEDLAGSFVPSRIPQIGHKE